MNSNTLADVTCDGRVRLAEIMSRRLDSDLWHSWRHQTLQCTPSKVRLLFTKR